MQQIDNLNRRGLESARGRATQPTNGIEVRPGQRAKISVGPRGVGRAAGAELRGIQVGSVFEEQKAFDVNRGEASLPPVAALPMCKRC